MTEQRVTLKGNEIHLSGMIPGVGDKAPEFQLVNQELKEISLSSFGSSKKILNIFPSLDTDVCSKALHTFHEKLSKKHGIQLLNISMDLPFAATRFCKNENLSGAATFSAFRSTFPDDYGVRISDGPLQGLCARVVLVLNEQNMIVYREIVPEITQEPDYEAALGAI